MDIRNFWTKLKTFCREYISVEELVVLAVVGGGVLLHLSYKEYEQRKLERVLAQIPSPPIDPEKDERMEWEKNAENSSFKTLDTFYEPYLVDSLCRFTNEEKNQGFLTLSKKAPKYSNLQSTEKDYFMWVEANAYFPMGQLLRITGVAENDELLQFHFVIDAPVDILERLANKMDSLQHKMKGSPYGKENH